MALSCDVIFAFELLAPIVIGKERVVVTGQKSSWSDSNALASAYLPSHLA